MKHALFALLALFVAGCSGDAPMQDKTDKKIMLKYNQRTKSENGWTVEVWTLGGTLPATIGVRLTKQNAEVNGPPTCNVRLTLFSKDDGKKVSEANVTPKLTDTAIPGGYWEAVRADDLSISEAKEKFVGQKGMWEAIAKNLFADVGSNVDESILRAEYTLVVEVTIDEGPRMRFDDLRAEYISSRDPYIFRK